MTPEVEKVRAVVYDHPRDYTDAEIAVLAVRHEQGGWPDEWVQKLRFDPLKVTFDRVQNPLRESEEPQT